MNGARALVEMLREYGVEVIFGVPGDTSIKLYEALYDASPGIRHVLCRDERSASFMADAYARLSHRPGLCECPSGAGPLYSAPGVAEANASSIPVILITSDTPLSGEGKQTITELDAQGLFESITKWSTVVKQVDKTPETVRRAFRIATTGRPGAVHLVCPQDVMAERLEVGAEALYAEPECRIYPAYRTRGGREAIREAAAQLAAAQRPVIVAGGGANHSQAGQVIAALAQWLAIPVATTISGQGIIDDDHDLAIGVIGDNGYHPHAHLAVEESDLLFYVGCKMGSVSTIKGTMPTPGADRRIMQVDLNPELLGNNYRNILSISGDARLVLEDVLDVVREQTSPRRGSEWVRILNQARERFWREARAELESDQMPLKPQRIVAALNRRIQSPTVVIADAGTPTPYITRFLRLRGSGSRFLIPRSYGGLGYAIPATVGAYFACPRARPIGLFGDGSLGMSAGELETLARLNIPAILIHFNNGAFGWIKSLQKLHCQAKYYSVDFTRGDPAATARSFGLEARKATRPEELEEALDQAFAAKGPFFLDIDSEPEVDQIPPVYSWQKSLRDRGAST